MKRMCSFTFTKELNISWTLLQDTDFGFVIINAENTTSHKHVLHNTRSMFTVISETTGNSALIPRQNSFNHFS